MTNFAFEKQSSFLISELNQSLNYTTVGWLQATLHKIYTSCLAMYQTKAHCQLHVNCFPFLGLQSFWAPSSPTGPNHKIHALPRARETPTCSGTRFAGAETTGINAPPLTCNVWTDNESKSCKGWNISFWNIPTAWLSGPCSRVDCWCFINRESAVRRSCNFLAEPRERRTRQMIQLPSPVSPR